MHFQQLFARLAKALRGRPIARTRGQVADILSRELAGTATDPEWDEFICVPIEDPELDQIRESVPMESVCTPEGRLKVEDALKKVRG
jgi:hypothetical protein